jgi:hypothetical protein
MMSIIVTQNSRAVLIVPAEAWPALTLERLAKFPNALYRLLNITSRNGTRKRLGMLCHLDINHLALALPRRHSSYRSN